MIAAVAMVKDEADVLSETLRRMAGEVDLLIVADNASGDGTRDLLEDLARELPLRVVDDPEVAYYQAAKISRLAALADELGATWVVPFDADERWHAADGRIADVLAGLPAEASIATASLFDHVATAADPAGPPLASIQWRRATPAPLPKVACRTVARARIHQGNHGVDFGTVAEGLLTVRHFPYRSPAQFVRKVRNGAAAYAATDLPEDIGAHWRQYGALLEAEGPEAIEEVFRRYFWSPDPLADAGLVHDPCP